jgi:hypothetical protein
MGAADVDSDELDELEDGNDGDSKEDAEEDFGFEIGVRLAGHSSPAFRGAVTWMVSRSSRRRGHKVRIPLSVQ